LVCDSSGHREDALNAQEQLVEAAERADDPAKLACADLTRNESLLK
jgi:hypothetical protein